MSLVRGSIAVVEVVEGNDGDEACCCNAVFFMIVSFKFLVVIRCLEVYGAVLYAGDLRWEVIVLAGCAGVVGRGVRILPSL